MFQILLCDDEPAVTSFLKKEIPWESLGIENVYTAFDGEEALRIYYQNRIDLLITDISMPKMDGLKLLETIRGENSSIHCILLTAYGEFAYAQKALSLGVDNYLLKPIQVEELTATIENAIENIYLDRKNKAELFRDNILRRWLNGEIGQDELSERSELIDGLNIYQASYMAICMSKLSDKVSLFAYVEECAKLLRAEFECNTVWDNENHIVLIVGGHKINRDEIHEKLQSLARHKNLENQIFTAIGPIVSHSEKLSQSYKKACRTLDSMSESGVHFSLVPEQERDVASVEIPVHVVLSPIVQKALDYIHQKYADGISIKDFCTDHTITQAYLGYLFKQETGTFFNTYLNAYRMEKAISLLLSSKLKINEIAERTVFSSTSYFITSFRKFTGISPQNYREVNEK